MQFAQSPIRHMRQTAYGFSALVLTLVIGMALVPTAGHAAEANGYQKERATCINGQSNEDRATCLKEAGAARGEAKRGNLTEAPGAYESNALARCNVLPPADRDDCVNRIRGNGTVSGSVGGGGVIRETRTIVPEPQPAPVQAPGNTVMPYAPGTAPR